MSKKSFLFQFFSCKKAIKSISLLLIFNSLFLSLPGIVLSENSSLEDPQGKIYSSKDDVYPSYEDYILGPGDVLAIDHYDIPELSGQFVIGGDGTLYLPRLQSVFVDGLTLRQSKLKISKKYNEYLIEPDISIRIQEFRPIRIYVGGEISRPGYYDLEGDYPTVFDALKSAGGITPFTNLSEINVMRKLPISSISSMKKTNVNLLSLITNGDDSQNIRLRDSDILMLSKSNDVLRDQILRAGQSNLSPRFISIFLSGRVFQSGQIEVPQGASLNDAISVAGGTKILKGQVEFIRFTREGSIDKRTFNYSERAKFNTYRNPVLMDGDIVRVKSSLLTNTTEVLGEITTPALGIYSFTKIFGF